MTNTPMGEVALGEPVPTDLVAALAAESRPGTAERPWVFTNMITSLDGSVAVDGLSSGLGGPADLALLIALRRTASALLVGSRTAASEGYQPPDADPAVQEARLAAGLPARLAVAIVSARLSIGPDAPIFSDPTYRPIVLTARNAPTDKKRRLDDVADIVEVGNRQVDLPKAITALGRKGHHLVLAEGGPTLNGQLVAEDLIDEWNMSMSPMLVAGDASRAARTTDEPATPPRAMELERLWHSEGFLFGRWLRSRD